METITESKTAKLPNNRIGFANLVKLIEKGKIDGIICWKLNRLARNPVDGGIISWLLQTGKLKCIKTSERCYYPTDNVLLFAVELGMANQEVRELSKNVARALESKASKGHYPGVPMIGYVNSKWRKKGEERILKDHERFPLVRKIWDLMLTGNYTPSEIRRIATTEWKLDTPRRRTSGGKPLAPSAIYKILTNIFYTGNFTYKNKFYRGNHPPMITTDEFERVQKLLGRKGLQKPITHDFPYTGIMRCENCGAAITATQKKKWNKRSSTISTYTYYHCTRRMGIDDCKEPSVTLANLELQIEDILKEFSIDTDAYRIALKILDENLMQDPAEQRAIESKQRTYISETRAKLDKLLTLLINDTISEHDYTKQKMELEQKLVLTETALVNANGGNNSQISKQVKKVFHFCHYGISALRNGDVKTKRSILSALGSNQRIKSKKLYVDKHNWLIAVKNFENYLQPIIDRLELEKASNDKVESLFLQYSDLLCGAMDNVRKELSNLTNPIPDLPHCAAETPAARPDTGCG